MMTPLKYYQQQLQKGLLIEDSQQIKALTALEATYHALCRENKWRSSPLARLRKPKLIPGNYLYGGVGIGKSFLMDCFFNALPFSQKSRVHFHSFMRSIHQRLKEFQGKEDPLYLIAKDLASKNRVLCFDELTVSDIADAMILGRLFQLLLSRGLSLIFTSNLQPDDLYKNGLQRQHFLPVIQLLKDHCRLTHLETQEDYRLRQLKEAGVFYTPNDELAFQKMEKTFNLLSHHEEVSTEPVLICDREIPVVRRAESLIWFDFNTLCSIPRSQHDYLAIAELYKTVFVSDLPKIPAEARDKITLLIRLIDVFYDARVRLVLSSEVPVDKIYTSGRLVFDYQRTCSRLLEMQSEQYFLKGLALE